MDSQPNRSALLSSNEHPSSLLKSAIRVNNVANWIFRAAVLTVFLLLILMMAAPALASTESTIYSFANPPDAYSPRCNLVADAAGNMYGVTFSGGAHNLGAVLMVTSTGTETVVYSFTGGADGSHPIAGLVRDKKTAICMAQPCTAERPTTAPCSW